MVLVYASSIGSIAVVASRVCRRPFQSQFLFQAAGFAIGRLPVRPQSAGADVFLLASAARVRPLVGVQPFVEFQVDELRKFGRTQVTSVGFLSGMEP